MIELTVSHDGLRWNARGGRIRLSAPTLDSLDRKVRAAVRKLPRGFRSNRVFMAFDRAAIPQWIRQYSQHYFNRIITTGGPRK